MKQNVCIEGRREIFKIKKELRTQSSVMTIVSTR